VGYP